MRKLSKVVISVEVDGVASLPERTVMTKRELTSFNNSIDKHFKKANDRRKAEADQLRKKLAELEG